VPLKPPRLAVAAACLLVAVAVLAGSSLGSPPAGPRATAPRLIAHDTSGFASHRKAQRKRALAGPAVYMDSTSDPSVANVSSDIGIAQLLVAANGTYSVRSRAGSMALLAQESNDGFWGGLTGPDAVGLCASNPQGQPSVAYDRAADRWVVSEAAYTFGQPYVECVAVSTSSDATGTWNRYVFQVSTTLHPDRATLAVWSDGYYLSFNQFDSNDAWAGAGALALERSKMLTGAAAQARYFDLGGVTPGLGGMLPADISDSSAPTANAPEPYLQAHDDPLDIHDRLEVWGFHVDWTAPGTGSTFQPIVNLPLDPGFPVDTKFACGTTVTSICLPQLGVGSLDLDPLAQAHSDSSDALSQLGGRLQWRESGGTEMLTATATVNSGSNAAPAWFRLTNVGGAGWTVGSQGVYNPADGVDRFLPSAASDVSGDVGLAFAETSSTIHPSLGFTNAVDNSFTEVSLATGGSVFAGSTYGRDTSLALDPVDGCTFWFSGPLPDNSGKDIAVKNVSVPGCTALATEPPVLTGNPRWTAPLVREGLTITGNAATFSGATSVADQWRRCDTRGLNCIDLPGETASTHVMTASDAAGTHTLRFAQTATNPTGSSTSISAATTLVQSIPPLNLTLPVLSGTAQSGQTLATTNGTWQSSSPLSFTYRWRRCTSGVCANIAGATTAAYALTDADVGSTVDAVVSATNTGGGTDANATATVAVAAAPTSGGGGTSGGSSGGGGSSSGGSPGSPDLVVTGNVNTLAPAVGSTVAFALTITDKNLKPASSLLLTNTLSSGLQYISASVDRGNGCASKSATQVVCNLDWLSGDVSQAHVQVFAKVTAEGVQTFTASALAGQGELNAGDNAVTFTLNAPAASSGGGARSSGGVAGIPTGLNGGASSPTPTKVVDHKKPTARALKSAGKRGRTVALRFRIYDDQGIAKAIATVKRKGKKVSVRRTGFGPVAFGSTYYVGWKIPKKAAKGKYSFCVVAVDRAGNKSRASCGALTIK
jgi:uncharacterized repeat protein (TIGR01451 family)